MSLFSNNWKTSRREVLRLGSLGYCGLTLPRLLAANEGASGPPIAAKADACILIFLNGGPSHLDMWDMKPDAPDGIRGEFKPIPSSLPGYFVSDQMPRLARKMHLAMVCRSMHHSVNNAHAQAVYTSITGHDRGDAQVAVGAGFSDNPTIGSTLTRVRPPIQPIVPHVCLPYITKEGAGGPPQPGFTGGWLGGATDPLFVLKNPDDRDFSVPELTLSADVPVERLSDRRSLLGNLLPSPANINPESLDTMNRFQTKALDLLSSPTTQKAFRIQDEPLAIRESYGRNIYGQSVLLARRLIEAGTRMVTISWAPDANATWDTHGGNFSKLKNTLLPQFDASCASLVQDLEDRGMLERTLIAVMGDFGRTPKINNNGAGRDHWNYCYSVMMIGGGFRPGLIYGASDKIGAFPARDPATPGDCVATIYRALGIDATQIIHDQFGRPQRLIPKGDALPNWLT